MTSIDNLKMKNGKESMKCSEKNVKMCPYLSETLDWNHSSSVNIEPSDTEIKTHFEYDCSKTEHKHC